VPCTESTSQIMAICTLAGLMAVTNRPAPDSAIGTQHPNLVMLWYRTLGDGRDYIPRRAHDPSS
jgi:hypothetical protein